MKLNSLLAIILINCLISTGLWAQQGTLRGKVSDGESGTPLLGATVRLILDGQVKGGAYSDLEGNYSLKAAPGTYTLIISYISYLEDTLRNVAVTAGEVVFNQSILLPETAAREDLAVEIVAKRSEASTVTLYNIKRTSNNSIDGVSLDQVNRTGDNSAAAALQRVTGVTVEGGKYVYVRGLGDRYSKTTLNGAELPGLDPNRNTVQMDIFPSNLIDAITVYKNFTPDLPGSFTGGLVDVKTKDFPDRFTLKASASLSFNPQSNLRDDFLTYETGKRDWLGYDDGTRAIPTYIQNLPDGRIPDFRNDNEIKFILDQATKEFDTHVFPQLGNSGIDQNYQLSIGNQYELGSGQFGFIANLSYRSSFDAYQGGTEGRYKNTSSAADGIIANSLNTELTLKGDMGQQEVLWGGLAKLSYKIRAHKLSFNYMHNQSGTSQARSLRGPYPGQDIDLILETRVLSYLQRAIDVYQLEGDHAFGKVKLDWIGSYTLAQQEEPDLRFFANEFRISQREDTTYDIDQSGIYTAPARFFRSLSENNYDLKVNLEIPFQQWSQQEGKIKIGGAYTRKERQFDETRYIMSFGTQTKDYDGDALAYFDNSNLGIVDTFVAPDPYAYTRYDMGLYFQDASEDRNNYTGSQTIQALYAMAELPLTTRLRMVGGVRYEGTDATTVSMDATVDSGSLELNDFLPALNFVFAVKENMNLRFGYSRTLARPTFREFAPFVSFDFAGDFDLVGNPSLQRTLIDNGDLRWEYFPSPSELISVSLFYKNFTNPIERILDPRAQNPQFEFRNVDQGVAYGAEFEIRKNFGFISDALSNLELGANLSLIQSRIDIDSLEYANILGVDPTRPNRRPMFGQSPYAVNMELAYIDKLNTGIQASLSYNVFGQRIAIVGGSNPDVYEQPRGLMNFSLSKDFGLFSVRLRANNLLNPAYKMTQNYLGQEYIFRSNKLGRSYSLGVSLSI